MPGLSVFGSTVTDGGVDRRPAITIAWTATGAIDARGVIYEVRRAGSSEVKPGSHGAISTGFVRVTEGILPGTAYEVRARLIMDRAAAWSVWVPVTTPDVRLGLVDLNGSKRQLILPGEMGVAGTNVHGTLNMGAVAYGSFWQWSLVFEARKDDDPWTLALERRRLYAGAWSGWEAVRTFSITSSYWSKFSDAATLPSGFDGWDYRVTSYASGIQSPVLRNLYLILVNIAE